MKTQIRFLTRTAMLLALILVIQLPRFPQFITGTGVNMFFFLAVFMVGVSGGCVIGLFTPIIALSVGIMGFAPLVPFIIAGNLMLIITFELIKRLNKYLAVLVASLLKFLILSISVTFIINAPQKVASMMQLPQLFTALTGGVLALIVIAILDRGKVRYSLDDDFNQ